MELEDHHEVRELGEPGHGVGPEQRAIETDHRLHATPVVVDRLGPATQHESHRLQRDHEGQS